MQGSFGLCGVILAAGESSRMGTDKALLPWPPPPPDGVAPTRHTLLSSAILALEPHTRAVVVVAGKNADAISTIVGACGAYMVRNPDPSRGQFSSIQIGLRAVLDHGCESAMITPVDCPPLSQPSIAQLCASFQSAVTHGLWAVAPENNGNHGHPLFASRELIGELIDAPVTGNARDFLHAHSDRIVYVPVPDDLSRAGMNTPEEYAAYAVETPPPN
jgi:molybdenum cofactor cytidylyltransferase